MNARSPSRIVGCWDPEHPTYDVLVSESDQEVAVRCASMRTAVDHQSRFSKEVLADGVGGRKDSHADRMAVGIVGEMAVAYLWGQEPDLGIDYSPGGDLVHPVGGHPVNVKTMRVRLVRDNRGNERRETCPYIRPNRPSDRHPAGTDYMFCTWDPPVLAIAGWMTGWEIRRRGEKCVIGGVPHLRISYLSLHSAMCLVGDVGEGWNQ